MESQIWQDDRGDIFTVDDQEELENFATRYICAMATKSIQLVVKSMPDEIRVIAIYPDGMKTTLTWFKRIHPLHISYWKY